MQKKLQKKLYSVSQITNCYFFSQTEALNIIPSLSNVVTHEPFADSSQIPSSFVKQSLQKNTLP